MVADQVRCFQIHTVWGLMVSILGKRAARTPSTRELEWFPLVHAHR